METVDVQRKFDRAFGKKLGSERVKGKTFRSQQGKNYAERAGTLSRSEISDRNYAKAGGGEDMGVLRSNPKRKKNQSSLFYAVGEG